MAKNSLACPFFFCLARFGSFLFSLLVFGCTAPATPPTVGQNTSSPPTLRDLGLAQEVLLPVSLVFQGTHLFEQTYERLPTSKAKIHCSSCHLHGGTESVSMPLVDVSHEYPQYSERAGGQMTLVDRINLCLEVNMNGSPLSEQSQEMQALLAYIDSLKGDKPQHRGIEMLADPPERPSSERGQKLYALNCQDCHGVSGSGKYKDGAYQYPAIWGGQSFTAGADMAQARYLASFLSAKMPLGRGKSLEPRAAWDIATYIVSQPRPADPRKSLP